MVVALLALALPARAVASPIFEVTFDDPQQQYGAFYSALEAHAIAAGNAWGQYVKGNGTLTVSIAFSNQGPTATGGSATSVFVGTHGMFNVYEQGAAGELRTGIDPNGAAPDILFNFNPNYLANELWFDPDPVARGAVVPNNRTDAQSVMLHEFGHVFAFNGWRNSVTGLLPADYESTFDRWSIFDGDNFYFLGPTAMDLYGGRPVPLTFGNIMHLGNAFPRPGSDLLTDLMNGVVFIRGNRYGISALDVAVLADSGVQVMPEPATLGLLAIGVAVGIRRRLGRHAR
jgi:hypothetical protein